MSAYDRDEFDCAACGEHVITYGCHTCSPKPRQVADSRPCLSLDCTRRAVGVWTDQDGNRFPACDRHRNDLRAAPPAASPPPERGLLAWVEVD